GDAAWRAGVRHRVRPVVDVGARGAVLPDDLGRPVAAIAVAAAGRLVDGEELGRGGDGDGEGGAAGAVIVVAHRDRDGVGAAGGVGVAALDVAGAGHARRAGGVGHGPGLVAAAVAPVDGGGERLDRAEGGVGVGVARVTERANLQVRDRDVLGGRLVGGGRDRRGHV